MGKRNGVVRLSNETATKEELSFARTAKKIFLSTKAMTSDVKEFNPREAKTGSLLSLLSVQQV